MDPNNELPYNISNPYCSYILDLAQFRLKNIYDQYFDLKANDPLLNQWPRINDYDDIINNIVYVGKKNPDVSISTIHLLLSRMIDFKTFDEYFLKIFKKDGEDFDDHHQIILNILFCFVSSDSMVQLLLYIKDDKLIPYPNMIFTTQNSILTKIVGEGNQRNFDSRKEYFSKDLIYRLLQQVSVIAFRCQPYSSSFSSFEALLNKGDIDQFYADCSLILYQYTKYPDDPSEEVSDGYPLAVIDKICQKADMFSENILHKCIESALIQLPPQREDKEMANISQYAYNNNLLFPNKLFEIKALVLAKGKDVNISNIASFLNKNKASDERSFLKGFLYLIRDPHFRPIDEFWEYGKGNENFHYFLSQEKKKGLSKIPENSKENGTFIDLFFNYALEKISNNELSTKIIYNILSRDIANNVDKFVNRVMKIKKGLMYKDFNIIDIPKIAAPFFNALSVVFDPISDFDLSSIVNELINNHKTSLKDIIIAKYSENLPEISEDPLFCKMVSYHLCPDSLLANQVVKPEISEDDFNKRIFEANKITDEAFQKDNFDKTVNGEFFQKNIESKNFRYNEKETEIEWEIKVYLITILFHIIDESDLKEDFFIPLVKMCLGKSQNLAYFSLYALQIFFIRKEFTIFKILDSINKVMKETFGKKNAFTLLNLLHQLLTFPPIELDFSIEEQKNWFKKWLNQTQAILLAHLTSQYVEVRDITLLVIEKLDLLLASYDNLPNDLPKFTIESIIHQFNDTMMNRIANRLKITDRYNDDNLLQRVNFKNICRSSKLDIYLLSLNEFAQALQREEMRDVLSEFYELELINKISKIQIGEKGFLWKALPIITFSQRVCPLCDSSKEFINKNLNLYTGDHSLITYQIYRKGFSLPEDKCNAITELIVQALYTKIKEACDEMDDKNSYSYCLITYTACSLSLELVPKFIKEFFKATRNKSGSKVYAVRYSDAIKNIVLSTDFNLFVSVHMDQIESFYSNVLTWFNSATTNPNFNDNISIFRDYCLCVESLSKSILLPNLNGSSGAVRSFEMAPWFNDNLDIGIRQACFTILFNSYKEHRIFKDDDGKPSEASKLNKLKKICLNSLLALVESFSFYQNSNSDEKLIRDIYNCFIEIESNNQKVYPLYSFLVNHNHLFDEYLTNSINLPIEKGSFFFRAIAEYFTHNENNNNIEDLSEKDKEANKKVVDFSGKIIIAALIFIGTPDEKCRKSAFDLLKRTLPIICTFQDCKDIRTSGKINSYLKQHQTELSILPIEPTKQQVYELADFLSQNMPYVVTKVFEEFFNFFMLKDLEDPKKFKKIDSFYVQLILNAVSPFAKNLIFEESTPVYPCDFHATNNIQGIDFIKKLINIYPILPKNDLPFYAKIFADICTKQENIETLAKLLIMNYGESPDPDILNATTTILLYLIQNSDSSIFLSLLVQRFSFGYWFTSNYGSTQYIQEKPYRVFDWIKLTMNVLNEVAAANFSLLLPYIHTIIHFCLIYYNQSETINTKLPLLLQEIINNLIGDDTFVIPENSKIGFQYKTKSNSVPISIIISNILEPLKKIAPQSLKDWKNEALQWATSCGDIEIAEYSAVIYSLNADKTLSRPEETDNEIIIKALNLVMREYQMNSRNFLENNNNNNKNSVEKKHLYGYVHGCLQMLISNLDFIFQEDESDDDLVLMKEMILNLANIFISDGCLDEETSKLGLEIIFYYANKAADLNSIDTILLHTAISFNNVNIPKILAQFIISGKSKDLIIRSLGNLLPFFYAALSAFQSISPFATFISDQFISALMNIGIALQNVDFAYTQIFKDFFKVNENIGEGSLQKGKTMHEFISAIVSEMWKSDVDSIKRIIDNYDKIIVTTHTHTSNLQLNSIENASTCSSNVVRDIIYLLAQVFVQKCPNDKLDVLNEFNSLLLKAYNENSPAAREFIQSYVLIATNTRVQIDMRQLNIPKPGTESKSILSYTLTESSYFVEIPKPTKEEDLINNMMQNVINITKSDENINFPEEINFTNTSNVLMICNDFHDLNEHYDVQIKALKNIRFQPFQSQNEFWNIIASNGGKAIQTKGKVYPDTIPTVFEFFAHANAKGKVIKTTDQLYAPCDYITPNSFALRDDEFDSYDNRHQSNKK